MDDYTEFLRQRVGALADRCLKLNKEKEDFINACQGEEEPRLWRLSWAECLFEDLWHLRKKVKVADQEDLDKAYAKTCELFRLLRAALRAHTLEE